MNTPDPNNVIAASKAAPNLDPQSVLAAGSAAASPAEAAGFAQATQANGVATKLLKQLGGMDPSHQLTFWQGQNDQKQNMLRSIGYTPPKDQGNGSGGGGWLSDITSSVGHAFSTAVNAGKTALGDTLSVAGSGLRFTQHVMRSGIMADDRLEQQGKENNVGALFSPSLWAKAWDDTSNGQSTFDPIQLRKIQGQYDPDTFKIAKMLASGEDEADVVKAFPTNQQANVVRQIASDPDVKTATTQLNNAHLSFGRWVVGSSLLNKNPTVGKALSGTLDATFDILGDPLNAAGGVGSAAKVGKWGMDGGRVAALMAPNASDARSFIDNAAKNPAVQREFDGVVKTINSPGGYGALMNRGKWGNVAGDMSKAGVHDDETLKNYLASNAGIAALLGGNAAKVVGHTPLMPHLTVLGQAKLAAKNVFGKGVDFAADHKAPATQDILGDLQSTLMSPEDTSLGNTAMNVANSAVGTKPVTAADVVPVDGETLATKQAGGGLSKVVMGGPTKVAQTFRNMTTLTADKPYLDLTAPDAGVNLKRMLQYSLPAHAVNHVVDAFVRSPSLGQKFDIAKGGIRQMLNLAGVSPDIESQFADAIDASYHSEAYSPLGLDKMADGTRAGVLDGQESQRVFLPSFKEVRSAARQDNFLRGAGINVPGALDKFMNVWRAGVLMRPGFALRVALDETLGDAARNGITGNLGARFANYGAKKAARAANDQMTRLGHAVNLATSGIPEPIMNQVRSTKDLASATVGDAAYKVFGKADGLTRQDYQRFSGLYHEHVHDVVAPNIYASFHGSGGVDPGDEVETAMKDGKPVAMGWKKTGTYSDSTAGTPMFRTKWRGSLGTVGRSKIGQQVLGDIDKTTQTQVRNVVKLLQDPDFQAQKSMFERSFQLPDGRQLGEVSQDQIDKNWAQIAVKHVNALVRSGNPIDGPVLHDLVGELRSKGDAPSQDFVDNIPDMPHSVYGQDLVPFTKTQDLIQKGFAPLTKAIDWISREPNTQHAFALSMKDIMPWAEKLTGGPGPLADEMASKVAAQRAMQMVKPYIHNPEIRSQFEVMHRTAMPFLFAQDQFIKRWTKTLVTHPQSLAKAQLGMNGLETMGVVHKDDNGDLYFNYPGSQYVTTALARAANAVGLPASLPLSVPFTGQVKYIMPGLDNPFMPSVGPTVAIPVKALATRFPELQTMENGLLGAGAANSYWEQIMPTTVSRLFHAFTDTGDTPGQVASAAMKAMQMLDAEGHGLQPGASTAQKEQYIKRVTNWARINMAAKAMMGFVSPATPDANFDPKNLNADLTKLMSELPYNQAISEFLREHPDANAYTVFASKSTGGAELPAAASAAQFMSSNADFVKAFPQAAGWFMPRSTGNEPFDSGVYREQIDAGMRNEKTPSQFLDDILIAPTAKTYYDAYDAEQAALTKSKGDSNASSQIKTAFDSWKQQLFSQNPTFADSVNSAQGRVKRQDTLRELDQALTSTSLPDTPQTNSIKAMVSMFDEYQQLYAGLLGNTTSVATKQKTAIKGAFTTGMTQYAKDHPEVADLWNVLLRPEVEDTSAGLGISPQATSLVSQETA